MYNPSMIIYGELLIAENTIIGAALLYITAMIHGIDLATVKARLRLLAGSVMCGAFSLVIFLDAIPQALLLMEAAFAAAVCTVSFGRRRVKTALTFILVTYFMGGITMALLLLTRQTGIHTAAGIYTGDMKAAMLAAFIVLGCITARRIISLIRSKKLYEEHSGKAVIAIGEESFEAAAFFDTGNRLKEPITGKPAAVASRSLWQCMQSRGLAPGKAPVADTDAGFPSHRYALIPYETVGAKGMLEAVRTDYIEIGGHRINGCFVAGSDGGFVMERNRQAGGDYDLLIPAEMIKKEI